MGWIGIDLDEFQNAKIAHIVAQSYVTEFTDNSKISGYIP
jgi:hypothetical protein